MASPNPFNWIYLLWSSLAGYSFLENFSCLYFHPKKIGCLYDFMLIVFSEAAQLYPNLRSARAFLWLTPI